MYRLVGIASETKPRRDLDPWEVDGAGFGVASDEDDSQIDWLAMMTNLPTPQKDQ